MSDFIIYFFNKIKNKNIYKKSSNFDPFIMDFLLISVYNSIIFDFFLLF